jgi:hypothetical protein
MEKPIKPLGIKAYGSIPHLPGSRLGPADHKISAGQARIATEASRKWDQVFVQEKLDGACVAVAKIDNKIIALSRSGYPAESSEYPVHLSFAKYVAYHRLRFDRLLRNGERVVGEWIDQAVGTLYHRHHEAFVPFDLMVHTARSPYHAFEKRVLQEGFTVPNLIHVGGPLSIEAAMEKLKVSGHGAIDPVEGAIWRVENAGQVDFLTKFVRHDKVDGKYFPINNGGKITYNTSSF